MDAIGRQRGLTLIELMVALAIGMFLILGAVTIFLQGRTTFRVTESIARLQENARFALDVIEPDIRMAHYWGLTTRATKIQGRAAQTEPASSMAGVPHDCGDNWVLDLENAVEASNNGYPWACDPPAAAGDAAAGADTLVIRRASQAPVAPAAGWIHLQSARFQDSALFVGATPPAGYPPPPQSDTYRLIVNGYYVSEDSTVGTPDNPVPSLRRKTLGAGPALVDEEVLPGVEDMQIQLGVDTDPVGGADRGSVDRYVNANDPILDPTAPEFLPDAEVLAVRIWLRLRAERPEVGYTDRTAYVYADRNLPAFNDGFRRLVVSKTIYLRNARPAT